MTLLFTLLTMKRFATLGTVQTNAFSPSINSHIHCCPDKTFSAIFADVAAIRDGDQMSLLNKAIQIREDAIELAKGNDFSRGLESIRNLIDLWEINQDDTLAQTEMPQIMDDAVIRFTSLAFTKPYRGYRARWRVNTGLEALQMQLLSFPSPYDQVPRHVLIQALRALSTILSQDKDLQLEWRNESFVTTDTAFRIFQRLLTGVGVRTSRGDGSRPRVASGYDLSSQQPKQHSQFALSERDFNAVLNAAANVGRMDLAHKVVALQERTHNAPPLSPVTYSILLKGYGRLRDIQNVEMTMQKAQQNGVYPDTVMLNSILDALVNCNKVDKAKDIFVMATTRGANMTTPNLRTYNTMLKGFAVAGSISQAKDLTKHMLEQNLWDAVTTNTLVSAAVKVKDFDYAEYVLSTFAKHGEYTKVPKFDDRNHNWNVEAYTQLLDGYAKAGMLGKALETLQRMRSLQIMPNEYTYTCMTAGLARMNKFDSAMKLVDFMEANGTTPTVVTYNAFLSSLSQGVTTSSAESDKADSTISNTEPLFVDQAMKVLQRMISKGVRPTLTTVTTLLECFAKCSCPRIGEATAIVQRFEQDGVIPKNDARVNTAMLRVYGAAKDIKGALRIFRSITKPDIVAVNAFLDAACKSGEVKIAFDTFDFLFGPRRPSKYSYLSPDVITFSILMSSQLRLKSVPSARKAQGLYQDMRSRQIQPDIPLVDMILAAMTKGGRIGLQKKDLQFTLQVLKDAKDLDWKTGELEERLRTVRAIMISRMSEVWKLNEDFYGMNMDSVQQGNAEDDDLLRRKGWNKVDSGFRLWGGGDSITWQDEDKRRSRSGPVDNFLASKGWNDVDSGFRLF